MSSTWFSPNGLTAPSPSSRRIGRDSGSGGRGAVARMPSRGPVGRRVQASTVALLARRCGRARRTTGQASAWRQRMTGSSETAVTGCLSESVIKAHATRVKSRRAVAQPWRKSGCRGTEPGTVDRVPAWLVAASAARSPPVRFSTPATAARINWNGLPKAQGSLQFGSEARHDRGATGSVGGVIGVAGLEHADPMESGQ